MVRLGRRSFTTGRLTAESMDLAVRALVNFKRLLARARVDRMRAVATSAVREARNRAEFIRRIKRETGIDGRSDLRPRRGASSSSRPRATRSGSTADRICWSTSAAAASNWCWCATAARSGCAA